MASVNISADQISEARQQGYSDDQIAGFLSKQYPTQFQDATDNGYSSSDILNHFAPPPSQGSDIATGTEKALAEAPGKVIGTPGDLEAGTDWLSNKASGLIGGALDVSPSTQSTMDSTANAVGRIGLGAVYPPALLGSGLTSNTINNATGANSLPDAQTPLGQGAQLATGVASNPFSYLGPGGALRSLGSSLGSAVLSSGANAGAKALGASDGVADAVGAGAGFLMPSLAGKGAAMTADKATEAADQLLQSGGAGRDAYRGLNFATRDGVMQKWAANKINQYGTAPSNAVDPRGFSATAAPETHAILNDIAGHQGAAWAPDMSDWYDRLNNVQGTTADMAAARDAAQTLKQRMSTFTTGQTLVGNPRQAAETFNDAQGNYAAGKRLETVNNNFINAQNSADAANSGLNSGNTLRGAAKQMINPNTNTLMGFNDPEVSALKQMNAGTGAQNFQRMAGNTLGGGVGVLGLMGGGVIGTMLGGPIGAAAGGDVGLNIGKYLGPMLAGQVLRRGYNTSVQNTANRIRAMIAARSPLAAATPGFAPTPSATAIGGPALRRILNAIQGSQQQ